MTDDQRMKPGVAFWATVVVAVVLAYPLAGIPCVQGLKQLRQLDLANTQVTDAGMSCLAGMTTLKGLNLENTRITDAGLAHLKTLTGLQILHLNGTHITEAGVARLKYTLPNLWIDGAPAPVDK